MHLAGISVKRFSLASLSACAALLAGSTAPADAAVTVGETFTGSGLWGGSGVMLQVSSPGNLYAMPDDGVITTWRYQASPGDTPPLKVKALRHAGGVDFTTVGESRLETPTPGALNTWPTRIAVSRGDVLGLYFSDDTSGGYRSGVSAEYATTEISGDPGDPMVDPPPGTTTSYESPDPGMQVNVSAVLEPDTDRDGFGDETQDKCVGTPGPSNGCPSTVAIGNLKQKGDAKVKVTVTVPGAGTLAVGSPSDKKLASASAKSLKAVKRTLTRTNRQRVKLTLKLTKSAIGKLTDVGKLKLKVKAVYTPLGGPPGADTGKKKLKS
jgi:hypothetical protein